MALTDKDIIITPNRGQAAEPKIEFRGASASLGPQTISLNVYPTDNGTISFEGSAGQLFSITNSLSGSIYSVNDVSGIPSIEVLDTGLVKLAQYGGNVLIGTGTDNGTKLQVNGGISTPTMWVNNSTSNFNAYNENIRLFPAGNNVSVIAFGATGTSGSPWNSILGYSDRFEIRQGDNWQLRSFSGYIDISGYAQATRFISTVATGTAPLTVTSTTAVTNLNADLLDGNHASAFYLASNPNGYTANVGTVTSVGGTGTVSGLTLSGTVTTSGNLTLGGTLSASIDNITDEHRLFNNMGDNHGNRTSFDATTPSYNFGWRFVQGNTNGPAVNSATQYYSLYVGLGNDYLATGANSYGMQLAIPRNVTTPYLAIRYNENNVLAAWQKISAGYADSAGAVAWANVSDKPDPVVTVTLTGDVTGTANTTLTDLGSGTITIATTVAANAVALGTDTTGNYMVDVSAGSGITVSHTQGEGSTATISHTDTSSQASVDNSGNTVIQDITLDTFGHITGLASATITDVDRLVGSDNRTISPSEDNAGRLRFGFTSWNNNNTTPYADFLHLRSYADSSGGSDNLVMFRKDAIGIRVWQQTFGSATAYATFKDVAFTDQLPTVNNGTLALGIGTAGATNTTVTIGTGTGFSANTASNLTYDIRIGPALTNLAALMTTAGAGFIRRGATADTYTIDTNTYLLAEADTLATVTARGNTATSASIAYFGVNNTTNTNGYGISLYNGAVAGEPTYGLMFQGTATFGTHGSVSNANDWATYFTMNNDNGRGWIFRKAGTGNTSSISAGGVAQFDISVRSPIFYDSNDTSFYLDPNSTTTSLQIAGAIEQGNNFAHPNIEWSASSTSTGMVIFSLPGGTGNYGMVHMVFDYYEYASPRTSTIIVSGHNWSSAWYQVSCNVVGFIDKTVRLGFKDGKYCVIFGGAASSWEYGTIRLRKIHNASFYNNIMDLGGAYSVAQTTTESFTNVTGDLRGLRTPTSFTADVDVRSPIFYDSNNTSFYVDPASNSILNTLTLGGFSQNNPVENFWQSTGSSIWDATNGMRFYWIRIGRLPGDGYCQVEIESKTDQNYAPFVQGIASFSAYNSSSVSVQFDLTTPQSINSYVAIDNNSDFWIRCDSEWGSHLRWRFIYNNGCTIWTTLADWQKTETTVPTTHIILRPGQTVRTTRGNVTATSPSSSGTNTIGSLLVRDTVQAVGQVVIGGTFSNTAHSNLSAARLMFSGGDADAQGNYYIGTNAENYGGNYNKLDLRWHTGIRMGAQPGYGGIRFYDTEDLGTQIFAIGKDGSYAQANQSMRAPIFYDLDDTNYYGDFASTSRVNLVKANAVYDSNTTRSILPSGAVYTTGASSPTGSFKIKLPNGSRLLYPMLSFTVQIYNYVTSTSRTYRIGGHFSNAAWYNVFAYCLTDNAGSLDVRFGYDASDSMCVWIGETTTTWSYPQVFVTDFQNGYSAIQDSWFTGWSITLVTSFDTVTNGPYTPALGLNSKNYNSYSPTLTGGGASGTWGISITGNAATATSANNIDGVAFNNSNSGNPVSAPNTLDSNGIGYVTNVSLLGQTDGALYSQAYSTDWQHQIYGDYRTGQMAIRGKNSGTWQAWRTVLDSSNWTSFVTAGATITDDTTTNATRYLLFDDVTSGNATSIGVSSTKLYFNPSTGQLNATDFNSLSDATKKENVKTIDNATQKIVAMRGVTFDWIENKKPSMGVIAQEVEEVVPEVVSTSSTGEKSVNYGALVGLLIQTVKEQNEKIEQLEKLINTLISKE